MVKRSIAKTNDRLGRPSDGKNLSDPRSICRSVFPENTVYIDFRIEKEIADYCSEHVKSS